MSRTYVETMSTVHNRGQPPIAFLDELVDWGIRASPVVFAPNKKFDIYSSVVDDLGPWTGPRHRRAAMLEVLRVVGGFESSWQWEAGIDVTNPNSNTPCSEEAGIFQCSGDSMSFSPELRQLLLDETGATDCETFIRHTKTNHAFALEYCARLIRVTTEHHGPIKRRDVNTWLRRSAVQEFEAFLPIEPSSTDAPSPRASGRSNP